MSEGKLKSPTSVFKHCPECNSPNIKKALSHVYCTYCPWSSVDVFEELLVEKYGNNLHGCSWLKMACLHFDSNKEEMAI